MHLPKCFREICQKQAYPTGYPAIDHNIGIKEECDLYNNTYFDYMKSKRKLGALDERIDMQTINIDYNRNDTPLTKQKYRFQEVKEDVNSILTRHRHRGSMNNIIH